MANNLQRASQKWVRLTRGVGKGVSGCPYIGTDLLGGGSIGPAIQVRDIGTDTDYTEGVGQIPP